MQLFYDQEEISIKMIRLFNFWRLLVCFEIYIVYVNYIEKKEHYMVNC